MTSPDTQDLARAVRAFLAALDAGNEKPWNDATTGKTSNEKESEQTMDDYWFRQRYDDSAYTQTEGMMLPVRCRCGRIYDLGNVEVTARYADCSMWKTPCCKVLADDRKPPWGISWYTELPRRDRAHILDDEDVTFPEEDRP